jgi:hypothetical protein
MLDRRDDILLIEIRARMIGQYHPLPGLELRICGLSGTSLSIGDARTETEIANRLRFGRGLDPTGKYPLREIEKGRTFGCGRKIRLGSLPIVVADLNLA